MVTEKNLFFHEHHFPGMKNQLYHNRLNDATTVDGKKLLLSEELQGDWTQRDDLEKFDKKIEVAQKEIDYFNDIISNLKSGKRIGDFERTTYLSEDKSLIDKNVIESYEKVKNIREKEIVDSTYFLIFVFTVVVW